MFKWFIGAIVSITILYLIGLLINAVTNYTYWTNWRFSCTRSWVAAAAFFIELIITSVKQGFYKIYRYPKFSNNITLKKY